MPGRLRQKCRGRAGVFCDEKPAGPAGPTDLTPSPTDLTPSPNGAPDPAQLFRRHRAYR